MVAAGFFVYVMYFYIIRNKHNDPLIKMVNCEHEWLLSFVLFAPDYRLRDVIIGAIEECGGYVYQVDNNLVTQGVNHCSIRFNGNSDLFAAVYEGPDMIRKAAEEFLGAELNIIEL